MKQFLILLLCLFLTASLAASAMAEITYPVVEFGYYEQDNDLSNGSEPIEWYVLDNKDGAKLLLSKYILDAHCYHQKFISIRWYNCDLRVWLNDEFMNAAFTAEEQERIRQTNVVTNAYHGNNGGEDTQDKVYLLSREEVLQYLPETTDRQAWPTAYAVARGSHCDSETGGCWWWLRSPGIRPIDASGVRVDGRVSGYGCRDVYRPSGGIRPIIWLEDEEE